MSVSLKDKIFYKQNFFDEEVEFFKVLRATTNTCEVLPVKKKVVFQNEDFQFVEPDLFESVTDNFKERCKVIDVDIIEFKSGRMAQSWDGKPVKQQTIIFLPVF